MPGRDEFNPEIHLEHVLFTAVLGLALGLVIAGVILSAEKGRSRLLGLAIVGAGLALALAMGLAAADFSPIAVVELRLKPYMSDVWEAAALGAAATATGLATAGLVLLAGRTGRTGPLLTSVAVVLVLSAGGLWLVDWYVSDRAPDHPPDTDTSGQLAATRVIEGLHVPTGIAVSKNGDLAVVELSTAGFHLYSKNSSGEFEVRVSSRLPVPDGLPAQHVAFHPNYPVEPVLFITAEDGGEDEPGLYVFRARIAGNGVTFDVVAGPLPTATLAAGGDHIGGGVAICGEDLYVSTSDAEPRSLQQEDLDPNTTVRQQAQQLDSAAGKVLHWRLEGVNLSAEGAAAVYALGFRNPFALGCNSSTGEVFLADNGTGGHDQIRMIREGSNHEWPLSVERNHIELPWFDSGTATLAPTGIAIRSNGNKEEFLVSAFASQALYALPRNDDGSAGRLRLLREVDGGAFAVAVEPSGCVYFSDAAAIWRLDDGRCQD